METIGEAGGNTNTPANKRINQLKHWFFTFNNYEKSDVEILETKFNEVCTKYLFQEEKGDNGTPHLQGIISLKKAMRWSELKLSSKIHWEKPINVNDCYNYCQKTETRVGNVYASKNVKIIKPLKIITELRDWQKSVVDMVKCDPDDRTIVWIYETEGNVGKTQLCKYLIHHHNAVPIEGKKNDILYCAAEFDSECYLMDLERSMEDYVSYAAIEKIKNGVYMCAKYESKPILRNSPHIIIFANFKPDLSALSKDRWKVYTIKENKLLSLNPSGTTIV